MKKECKCCHEIKNIDSFNKRKQSKDGLHSNCRECVKIKVKSDYDKNKKHIQTLSKKSQYKRKSDNKIKVFNYLKCHPCIDCGENNPLVLEFDHNDVSLKRNSVSVLLGRTCSWEVIKLEIDKCSVRCANCHRKKTAKQFNWYSYISDIENYL